ncbi:hypothetical protein [uncultured Dysosmobacter sp.]|uniref:hypothetical protein n=1 Tax=uncultured Dysosmobacter sp. TaxID=2591384 RepID=UPI002638A14B|nr:hypothetical protein [uncultured Dysosmobacter sp.]
MSTFDFTTLVTDRAAKDAETLRAALAAVNAGTASAEQLALAAAPTSKGAYNYTDLNRVTEALEALNALLASYGYVTGYAPILLPRPGRVETTTQTVVKQFTETVTEANVASYFDVSNSTYYFAGADGVWTSSNGGKQSTTASTVFTAKQAMDVRFAYSYSSETNYDKFTLKVAGTVVENAVSGATTSKTYAGTMAAGDKIELKYTKDSSNDKNDDRCTLSALQVTVEKEVTETVIVVIPDSRDPRRWYEEDHMTPAQAERFLGNVLSVYSAILTAPELPETMTKLDYNGANQIERALVAVSEAVDKIVAGFSRSGSFAFWSGTRPFPTAKSDRGRTWAELDDMHTTWRNWQVASWYLLLYGNLEAEGDVV